MTTLDALQTTLAAEHAAVYVYAALGGRTSRSGSPDLYDAVNTAYTAHRARRDQLRRMVLDRDGRPVAAEAVYELPGRMDTADQIARAALELERSCAATYSYLVANTVEAERRWAITALNETAIRELAFHGAPEILPGAADLAPHAPR